MSSKRNTRSQSMNESIDELSELNEILAPLRLSIEETSKALQGISKLYESKFLLQQRQICNLQTRVQSLEARLSFQEHASELHERKLDDLEQVSRKVNLRLKGIVVSPGETPDKIMDTIKSEIHDNGLDVGVQDLDRCHRVGKPYYDNKRQVQDVLVKFRTWSSRNVIYQNRKKFSFHVFADLTSRRVNLLKYARDQISLEDGSVNRVVDFVFSDLNCKIKFKSKDNKFFSVSSKQEFLGLVHRLDNELTLSEEFKKDENVGINYGMYAEEATVNEIFF